MFSSYPPGVTGMEWQINPPDKLHNEEPIKVKACPTCKTLGSHAKGEPKNVFACQNPSCNTLYFDGDTLQVIHII